MRVSPPQRWLAIILFIYAVLGAAYSVVTPLAEMPDELEHFRYMQSIVRSGQLPVMLPEREANSSLETHQPPLYYLLGSALFGRLYLDPQDNPPANPCFSFEPDDPGRKNAYLHYSDEWPPQRDVYRALMGMRWLSVLMGCVTVCLAYVIGRQVAPAAAWFGPAAAALLAFNPQFIFITASMNNDVPTAMLGAAIVALSTNLLSRPRLPSAVFLGIVTGLGLLTKFALIAFWPLALLAAVWPAILIARSPFSIRLNTDGLLGRLLAVILLPLLTAGWWYYRNYHLYGDPLMWDVTLAAKGFAIARTSPFAIGDLGEFLSLHFQSYWLWLGWLNIKAPDWLYGLLLLVCLAAAAGLVRLLLKRSVPVERPPLVINALAVLAIYAALLRYIQTINWTGYQGRLAYAAAASIAMFIALGLVALGGKKLAALAAGGLLLLATAALFFLLLPAYPRPAIYQPQRDLAQTCARFQGGLQVEAVGGGSGVFPGGTLPLTIYGYGLADAAQTQSLAVRLIGAEGQEVGKATTPVDWRAGEVVAAAVDLPVAEDAMPSRAVLQITMLDENGRDQTAESATGRVLDVPVSVQTVKIAAPPSMPPTPMFPIDAHFGDQLALLGYDIEEISGGLAITLYWRALEDMALDYTTFVHILDEAGQLLAQEDSQPTAGAYPTSIWDRGEIVLDRKELTLPQQSLDRELHAAAGAYSLETLQRLPVWDAGGRPQPGDQYTLPWTQ